MDTIVVTRHPALVALLRERGLVSEDCEVLTHVASPEAIRGRHVIGVLPLHLAAVAASVTEIPLALTPADRGVDLPIERMREIAGEAVTYVATTRHHTHERRGIMACQCGSIEWQLDGDGVAMCAACGAGPQSGACVGGCCGGGLRVRSVGAP